MNLLIHQHLLGRGALVHNIDLGYHSDCPFLGSVPFSCQFQAVRSCHILISRNHTQNDCLGILTVSGCHFSCDFFDIFLTFHVNSGDSGQIDQGEIWAVVGVNSELDWIINNITTFSCNLVCHFLDNWSDISEVTIHLASCIILENTIWFCISFPYLIKGLLLSVWTSLN